MDSIAESQSEEKVNGHKIAIFLRLIDLFFILLFQVVLREILLGDFSVMMAPFWKIINDSVD